MLVSFIIPAYNASETISRCLNSIYSVDLGKDDFEIIVIDDCSTDSTIEIVKEYAKNHGGLTLLCQSENRRQGTARNRGVSVAKGEYICFVDSDDLVAEGIVTAICMAKECQTDMLAFHYANSDEHGRITSGKEHLNFLQDQVFYGIEMQNAYPYWCSAPWGYIYSREFVNRVNYPFAEGVPYEDSDFVVVHLFYAKRMAYSPELGYIACYREGSTTHNCSYLNVADYLFLGLRMLHFYETIDRDLHDNSDSVSAAIRQFAEGILEGACWNVAKSLKQLIRLDNWKEIAAFYDRVDAHLSRRELLNDKRLRTYYWNAWTSLCLKYQYLATILSVLFRYFTIHKVPR